MSSKSHFLYDFLGCHPYQSTQDTLIKVIFLLNSMAFCLFQRENPKILVSLY